MNKEIQEIIEAGLDERLAVLIVKAGYTLGDLYKLSKEDIMKFRGVGKKKAQDIYERIRSISENTGLSFNLEYDELMSSKKLKDYYYAYVENNDCNLYSLKPLSVYTVNTFLDNDYDSFADVVRLGEKEIAEFDSKHKVISEELEEARKYYFLNNKNNIIEFIQSLDENAIKEEKIPADEKELLRWIKENGYSEKLEEFLRYTDTHISTLGFSNRTYNSLKANGISTRSELILSDPEKVHRFNGFGSKAYGEYLKFRETFLNERLGDIVDYCKGEGSQIKTEYYQNEILDWLIGNSGFHQIEELENAFPDLDDEELQLCLDGLKKKKRIKVNKNGVSYVLPSFVDVAGKLEEGRTKDIIEYRLCGKTLEEIGGIYGLTRERVRQIESKGYEEVVNLNKALNGTEHFKEEEYAYIYEKYNVFKEIFTEYLGLSEKEFNAAVMLSKKKGSTPFDENALDDENISRSNRTKIQKYFDRDIIKIKGERIPIRRPELRAYVLKRFCRKNSTLEEFAKAYNDFIVAHKLDKRDEDLLIKDSQLKSIGNHMAQRDDVLWKQWSKFRYYDIASRDYTEMFEELDLGSYQNIEISAGKLLNDNKSLLKRYDIHDSYELHNLLRKIYENHELHSQYEQYFNRSQGNRIQFKKMPTILFGEFDRDGYIKRLLYELSPVRAKDFVAHLSETFGYEESVIYANWFTGLTKYSRNENGITVFDVNAKPMSEENMEKLSDQLVKPFYTFDELRQIYTQICPEADEEEINAMNLKAMGYVVNYEYILTGEYSTMKEYMDALIEQCTSIQQLHEKTGGMRIDAYINNKQNDYGIIMYSNDEFISLKKLEQIGVNSDDLDKFVSDIEELVSDDEYFNYHTVKEKYGYHSILDNLGFDDYFYNRILAFSGRFSWTRAFGTSVFKKDSGEDLTKASFVKYQVKKKAPMDINDFIEKTREEYDTGSISKDKIVCLFDNEIYYNKVLEMVFADYASFASYIENY